jgi:hypothetical protein
MGNHTRAAASATAQWPRRPSSLGWTSGARGPGRGVPHARPTGPGRTTVRGEARRARLGALGFSRAGSAGPARGQPGATVREREHGEVWCSSERRRSRGRDTVQIHSAEETGRPCGPNTQPISVPEEHAHTDGSVFLLLARGTAPCPIPSASPAPLAPRPRLQCHGRLVRLPSHRDVGAYVAAPGAIPLDSARAAHHGRSGLPICPAARVGE